MSNLPPLIGQNFEQPPPQPQAGIPDRPKIAGIMIPKKGDTVYVFSPPLQGQAPYVYKGTIEKYPLRNEEQVDWSTLSLLVEEVIQPAPVEDRIPFVHRVRLGKILPFDRKFMRYFPLNQANQYAPIPDARYEYYLQRLSEEADPSSNEDPQGGGARKKRKTRSGKALRRKRVKKSQKRR